MILSKVAKQKFKIIEHRFENKTSQFILKQKVLFWWEKVVVHPYCIDPYTFVKLLTGTEYINRNHGDLISITLKETIKTKRKK